MDVEQMPDLTREEAALVRLIARRPLLDSPDAREWEALEVELGARATGFLAASVEDRAFDNFLAAQTSERAPWVA